MTLDRVRPFVITLVLIALGLSGLTVVAPSAEARGESITLDRYDVVNAPLWSLTIAVNGLTQAATSTAPGHAQLNGTSKLIDMAFSYAALPTPLSPPSSSPAPPTSPPASPPTALVLTGTVDQNSGAVCGQNVIDLDNVLALHTNVATIAFRLWCPKITLSPNTTTRLGQARKVDLSYSDFADDSGTVEFTNEALKVLQLDGSTIGTFGYNSPINFTSSAGCGEHTIDLRQQAVQGDFDAQASYTVQCSKGTVTPTRSPTPTVTPTATTVLGAEPGVVQADMTTHVTGSGFTPGAVLNLTWQLPDSTTEPVNGGPPTASATGTVDFFSVIMNLDEIGLRTLQATDTVHTATTTVVVQEGTMQPSGFPGSMVTRR